MIQFVVCGELHGEWRVAESTFSTFGLPVPKDRDKDNSHGNTKGPTHLQ